MYGKTVAIAWLIVSVALISGCRESFYEHQNDLDGSWSYKDTMSFNFDISDTTARYDFFLLFDHDHQFKYSNLWTFIKTVDEKGHYLTDTISCPLANPDGTWLGKSKSGDIHNRIMFKHKTGFPEAGRYCVFVEQAMRDTVLQHVKSVGFELSVVAP